MLLCDMMLEKEHSRLDVFLKAAAEYLGYILGVSLELTGPADVSQLPAFLVQRYQFVEGHILGRKIMFMLSHDDGDTPAIIAKHKAVLQRHYPDSMIVLAAPRMAAHDRQRLVKHHVGLIVPGNQLYLPELAIDMREHFRGLREQTMEQLTPATQLLVLAFLLDQLEETTATDLAKRFGYSAMSMGRAIAELEALEWVIVEPIGRVRYFRFEHARARIWKEARERLRSPVRKRRRIGSAIPDARLLQAGGTALAAVTDLSPPRTQTFAIAASDWTNFARSHQLAVPGHWDDPAVEIETWIYDPRLLGDGRTVDPISLWLSVGDTQDDRVAAAKAQLLGSVGL